MNTFCMMCGKPMAPRAPYCGECGAKVAVSSPNAATAPPVAAESSVAATETMNIYPSPPSLHWGFVLLLTVVTLGIFVWIWAIVQAIWVKRLTGTLKPLMWFCVTLGLVIVGAVMNPDASTSALGVLFLFGVFSMRRHVQAHYNSVEPIGLKLGDWATLFGSIFYLQYHFSRIARLKREQPQLFAPNVSPVVLANETRVAFRVVVAICGVLVLIALVSAALFLSAGGSVKGIWKTNNSQLAVANTAASTPQSATTPTETAVPTSAISTSISGTYQMKGSTRNVADSGQTQDQSRTGSLEIVEQSGGRLTFALNAALVVDEASGNVHTGDLEGDVEIHNGEAVYVHDNDQEAPGKCKLTMKVAADRIEVNQDQPCGFGTGVDASGTYVKISSEVPKLPKQQ